MEGNSYVSTREWKMVRELRGEKGPAIRLTKITLGRESGGREVKE